jgi:RimJ/RimL family protein N-acetyltransferase
VNEARQHGITTRHARPADCRLLFAWANDAQTRAGSFHGQPIPFPDHERWFDASLAGETRVLLVAEIDGSPVGLIRLDREARESKTAEIGITVAPEKRGRGLAAPLLLHAQHEAAALGLRKLVARIKSANEPSLRAFERAGFLLARRERIGGCEAAHYEREIVGGR